ncbi:MAG: fibrillarin-like rRNA/tRNA 2'-O-methyltransferase [Nanoarchaeota archaeon]
MNQLRSHPNLYELPGKRRTLFTRSKYKDALFDERIVAEDGSFFREFDPTRSKLAAAIAKGISQTGIRPGDVVLYLGAAHGYTVSFVSDIIGPEGTVFALDIAPRVVRDLYFVAQARSNVVPLLADASSPDRYQDRIVLADMVFQDIAQRDQVGIFLKNLRFVKKGGFGFLAVKSKSIDVARRPKDIYREVRVRLEAAATVVDFKELDPFEKDHAAFVVKKK